MINRRIVLASRPTGIPVPENFRFEEVPVPELQEGEVLLENRVFAIDPAVRGMLDDVKSYMPPVQIGGLIPAMVLGRVVASRHPDFREGDYGRAFNGWEHYSVITPGNIAFENVNVANDLPLTSYMGAIGWSGITAYVGLKKYGEFREGDEVLVSAAAGAVGSVAGQIARLSGAAKVIGTVGSDDKARIVTDLLGFDGAINYRSAPDLGAAMDEHFPEGIDLYFDNVGGITLDMALPRMKAFGRIPVCGMIANYNHQTDPYKLSNIWQVLVNRITMRGFLAYEATDMIHEAEQALADWVRTGKLVATENVSTGLESTPAAFIRLMSGETTGKTLVRLDESVSTLEGWTPAG
ncbi:NADP-dependent oxidoreductase [Novosphingobium cyanobacteriorum]|uniref:NADP-dependent oxidoreductase n=1 Tax=Novosphingobium cyanobacteriorum TaxID=3024215 RepID=A0ABT6CNC0_9SPHN|nr:NADP-dependent oxidoreductase [Novosphingobium cyanobacteriorum]MDF8333827.1 NADP-dependent oxidoreductase [Novosphingobium cyanobacteriorum]